jgi:trehalose-phosphatase
LEHLFSAWRQVAAQLRAARHILFLSDYDGTLAPIVQRPELANLSQETRRFLQALARQHRYTVGIISGRALKDLQQRVGIGGIIYAGNHGLEIEGPGLSFVNPVAEEIKPVFRLIHGVLNKALGKIGGVLVENKGLTLSVHYRTVAEDKTDEVRNIFERVIATARSLGKVRTTSGKKVYEVRPAVAWDKGKAIALLVEKNRKPKGEILPLFLGDDLTDEDGFKVINEYGGISIFVGDETGDSAARYFLRSPAEVEELLGMLLERFGKEFSH